MRHNVKASTVRAAVFQTDGFGRGGRVFAVPRANSPQVQATAQTLAEVLSEFDKADRAIAEMLSVAATDSERAAVANFADTERARLLARLRDVEQLVQLDRESVAARREQLLAVPPATDPATAILDAEVRRRVGELPEQQLRTLQSDLMSGKAERMLLALARDPLPTPHAQLAAGLWRNKAEMANADALAQLDAETEGCVELEAGVEGIRGALA